MADRSSVQYAKSDGLDIAFAVSGDGPEDVVLLPGFASHLDLDWAHREPVFRRLASFARLIRFDKRGMGLSDRSVPGAISRPGWTTCEPSWTRPAR